MKLKNSNLENVDILESLTLGKKTEYSTKYNPELLSPVPRSLSRDQLGITDAQPFFGCDLWHGYELSWLNLKGKPEIALARFIVPYDTPNLIESKSFKLYLNSFNQTRFESQLSVLESMKSDLIRVSGGEVSVELFTANNNFAFKPVELPGECIDHLDIEVDEYDLNPSLLACDSQKIVKETIHSHLLKSNCLITNQPDWASIIIEYEGKKIDQASLLRYLISFRQHNEFHEQCVERIYMDLLHNCEIEKLTVQALYTRRGGLDINPFRTSQETFKLPNYRINRQ